jgi:hypothetical protein
MIDIVRFNNNKDNSPTPANLSWNDLVGVLTTFDTREDKNGPCWSPCTYPPGVTRAKDNVTSVTALVYDLDYKPGKIPITQAEMEPVLERARDSGHAFVAHTSPQPRAAGDVQVPHRLPHLAPPGPQRVQPGARRVRRRPQASL